MTSPSTFLSCRLCSAFHNRSRTLLRLAKQWLPRKRTSRVVSVSGRFREDYATCSPDHLLCTLCRVQLLERSSLADEETVAKETAVTQALARTRGGRAGRRDAAGRFVAQRRTAGPRRAAREHAARTRRRKTEEMRRTRGGMYVGFSPLLQYTVCTGEQVLAVRSSRSGQKNTEVICAGPPGRVFSFLFFARHDTETESFSVVCALWQARSRGSCSGTERARRRSAVTSSWSEPPPRPFAAVSQEEVAERTHSREQRALSESRPKARARDLRRHQRFLCV